MPSHEMSSRELYLRLLRNVLPYWRTFALSIFAMVALAATEPLFPAMLKPLLDKGFVNKSIETTWLVPVALVGLFLLRGILTYAGTYAIAWVGNKVVMDLRDQMFRKIVSLPTPYYDNTTTGSLIGKIIYDVGQVTSAATSAITVLIRDSLAIVGLMGWMFYLNWRLTLISLTIAPIVTLVVKAFSQRIRTMSRENQRSIGDITQVLEETISCNKVVKIFGGQDYEAARFSDANNQSRRFNMKQTIAASATVPIVQFFAAIALAVIIYIAIVQSAADQTTVGGFVSFVTAMLMLLTPLKRLTGVNESMQRGLAAAESVFELMDETAEPDNGTLALPRASGRIEFHDVHLTYSSGNRPALDGVSLAIAPGETVALVGPSGGGKTSLVNLIPRFYHPTSGQILIDGHDMAQLKLADLRANVALVSQDVTLFNDTVAANIAYGTMRHAGEAEIIAAAEAAHAMEFIRNMPQGMQTLIGENGVRLSGGQRQRLAIARAILKNAPILILDEATASLDTQSERHVQAALETLMQGRTTIVIAHRLSTIENADRIVVLQHGRVAEIGTHQALIEKNGIYANLYRIQFSDESH